MDREESLFDQAVKRLDRAISSVEQKLRSNAPQAAASRGDQDRLAQELAISRAREKELEAAGAEASTALAKAIAEINAALESQGENA